MTLNVLILSTLNISFQKTLLTSLYTDVFRSILCMTRDRHFSLLYETASTEPSIALARTISSKKYPSIEH